MIETILDLKNNKKKTIKALDQQNLHAAQVFKAIKATCGNQYGRLEPLNITLQDLQDKDKVGVWWLVGGSFKGPQEGHEKQATTIESSLMTNNTLLKLAQKHHMNTNTRKEIFFIVMGSSDFMQAKTSLLKLNLKGPVSRDIIRVILYCMSMEKVYNPYYIFLICVWCAERVGERVTLLYTIWDFIKQVGEKGEKSVVIVARGCAELVWRRVVSIGILRPLMDKMGGGNNSGDRQDGFLEGHDSLFLEKFMYSLLTRKVMERDQVDIKSAFRKIWKSSISCTSQSTTTTSNSNSLDVEMGQWVLVYLKTMFKRYIHELEGVEEEVRHGVYERIESVKRIIKGMDS